MNIYTYFRNPKKYFMSRPNLVNDGKLLEKGNKIYFINGLVLS